MFCFSATQKSTRKGYFPFKRSQIFLCVLLCLFVFPALAFSEVKFETGIASNIDNQGWTTVNLNKTYTSMVVIATPNYDSSSTPLVTRIQNASGSSFQLRVDKADSTPTASITPIDVYYFVVEEGSYTAATDGMTMEAVKYLSTVTDENNSWIAEQRNYLNSYTSPVVLGQVMSYNDSRQSVFWSMNGNRQNPPDSANLYVGKTVNEDPDTVRADETIGYVVLESGVANLGGHTVNAGVGADIVRAVTDNTPPWTYPLTGLTSASVGVVCLTAMDGGNGGWGLLYGANPVSNSNLNISIDEDMIADTERGHTPEQAAYIVFEDNVAPIAADINPSVAEDTPLVGTLVATDAEGDTLFFNKATDPTHGSVVVNPDGSYTYTPAANYFGTDSFTFDVADGHGGTASGTVNITVFSANDAPTATSAVISTAEDTVSAGVTPSVVDPDAGDSHTFTIVTQPANGSASVVGNQLIYTPNADFHGSDSFTFRATDGGGLFVDGTASVTVTPVNDAPVATDFFDVPTNEDEPLNGILTATDVDGDILTFTKLSDPANGAVTIASDGTTVYTPNSNFFGSDSFTFTVSDGNGGSDTGTVSMIIASVNDLPVASDGTLNVTEDVAASGTLVGSDPVEGSALTYSVVAQGTLGSVVIDNAATGAYTYTPNNNANGADSFTFKVNDGSDDSNTATVTVTIAAVNDAPTISGTPATTALQDSPYSFTPVAADVDLDSLTYSINVTLPTWLNFNATTGELSGTPGSADVGIPISGIIISVTDSIAVPVSLPAFDLAVIGTNAAPTATSAVISTAEDTVSAGVTPSVIDPDAGDSHTFTILTQPANGSASVVGNQLIYTPNANVNGSDSFTFRATDGGGLFVDGTASVTVTPVNDAPTATSAAISTAEDTASAGVTPSVTDPDAGDSHTFTIVTQPANGSASVVGNQLIYTPNANVNGSDSFTFRATDGGGLFVDGTASVTVTPVNDLPVASDGTLNVTEDVAASGTLVGSDPVEGSALTYSVVAQGTLGSVVIDNAATGAYTYTPNNNANGADSFTFKVNDGSDDSNTATVTVTIAAVNDAPTISGTPATTALQDSLYSFTPVAADVDLDSLTYSINVSLPTWLNFNATTGELSGTPGSADVGIPISGIIISVTDSIAVPVSLPAFDLAVISANAAPTATSAVISTAEDTVSAGVTPSVIDPDAGDSHTFTILTQPANGSASVVGNQLIYTPNANVNGSDSFTFRATDGGGLFVDGTASVTVTPVNDAPTATSAAISTAEDTASASVTPSVTDPDAGDSHTFTILTQPANGSASVVGNQLIYTPNANVNGSDSFTFRATDGGGLFVDGTASVTVTPVNDLPVASDGSLNVTEDVAASGTLVGSDPVEGSALTYSVVAQGTLGSVVIDNAATGAYTYTPNNNANGADSFTFKVNDGSDDSNTATVTVTIAAVNDAPTSTSATISTIEDTASVGVTPSVIDPDVGDSHTFTIVTQPANGNASVVGNQLIYTPAASFSGSDSFTFRATDGGGLFVDGTASVTVTPANEVQVVASFNTNPSGLEFTTSDQIIFVDTSQNNPISWTWFFGDGVTSDLRNPMHTFAVPGVYTVTLEVSNGLTIDSTSRDYTITSGYLSQAIVLSASGAEYSLLQAAYDSAYGSGLSEETIKIKAQDMIVEDLWFDRDISILLEGGYDNTFENVTSYTRIDGNIIISAGKVTISHVIIGPEPIAPEPEF